MTGHEDLSEELPLEALDKRLENGSASAILVPSELVVADIWPTLVAATETDMRERGVVVARAGSRIIKSKIIEGYGYDNSPSGHGAAGLPVPMLPFGARSVLPRFQEIALVHTHPIPPELDHLFTNPISDQDIRSFAAGTYTAIISLDRGGAHMLARTTTMLPLHELDRTIMVGKTTEEVGESGGGTRELMHRLANKFTSYGLAYFFTPDINQLGPNVEFRNMRYAESIPPRPEETTQA